MLIQNEYSKRAFFEKFKINNIRELQTSFNWFLLALAKLRYAGIEFK
jgi:hypothetical protein